MPLSHVRGRPEVDEELLDIMRRVLHVRGRPVPHVRGPGRELRADSALGGPNPPEVHGFLGRESPAGAACLNWISPRNRPFRPISGPRVRTGGHVPASSLDSAAPGSHDLPAHHLWGWDSPTPSRGTRPPPGACRPGDRCTADRGAIETARARSMARVEAPRGSTAACPEGMLPLCAASDRFDTGDAARPGSRGRTPLGRLALH